MSSARGNDFTKVYQNYLNTRNKNPIGLKKVSPKSLDGRIRVERSSVPQSHRSYIGYENLNHQDLFDLVLQNGSSDRVKSNLSRGELDRLWDEFCQYIKTSLEKDMSVVVPTFATFTTAHQVHDVTASKGEMRVNRVPRLILSDEYSKKHGVKYPSYANSTGKGLAPPFKSSLPNSSSFVGDVIKDVFKIFGLCSQGVAGKKNIAQLKFNKMCMMKVNHGVLTIEWVPEFIKGMQISDSTMAPGQMKNAERNKKVLNNIKTVVESNKEGRFKTPKTHRPTSSPNSDPTHVRARTGYDRLLNKTLPCLSPVDSIELYDEMVRISPKSLKESWSDQIKEHEMQTSKERDDERREREIQDWMLKKQLEKEIEQKREERNQMRKEWLVVSPLVEAQRNTRNNIASRYRHQYSHNPTNIPMHASLVQLEEQSKRMTQQSYKEQLDKQIAEAITRNQISHIPPFEKHLGTSAESDKATERKDRMEKQKELSEALKKQIQEKRELEGRMSASGKQLREKLLIEGRDAEQTRKSKELAVNVSKQNYDTMIQKRQEAKNRREQEMNDSFSEMIQLMNKREEILRSEMNQKRDFTRKYNGTLREQQAQHKTSSVCSEW